MIALALVSAVHALVAGRMSGLEPARVPSTGVLLIEASLLPPVPLAAAGPAEVAESAPPAPKPPVVQAPEPPPAPEPEPDPAVVQLPPVPEPAPMPAVPPKVAPKRAAKARPPAKPAATASQRPETIAVATASGGGGPPRIAAATVPRHDAAYLKNPPPPYPAQARRRGLEGRVLVHATVAASGECTRAELRRSSGHEILDEAALRAVRGWRFVPAMRDGRPIEAGVDIPIVFRLED